MAKQSQLVMASEPKRSRQKSAISHSEYSKAHALFSGMTAPQLAAHDRAMSHVRQGLAAATPSQLAASGY